jgi:hypothetical protein
LMYPKRILHALAVVGRPDCQSDCGTVTVLL